MKEEQRKRALVTAEYLRGGISYRELGEKYSVSHTSIRKWIKAELTSKYLKKPESPVEQARNLAGLEKDLRAAQLRIKLLDTLLDIGKKQYGVDLRKKIGTRRSWK
jgi:transposase-like protein